MTTGSPPPAWYADPGGSGGLRYWDGAAWTDHVTPPPAAAATPGYAPIGGSAYVTPAPAGRRLWLWFAAIGALFVVAVIAGIVMLVPRAIDAGSRVTDEAAQSTAHRAADAAAELYALEGSYLGATPERLEDLSDSGLLFTAGPSSDFTTASVQAGEQDFVVVVASLTNRCFVVILDDEIGGARTTGRLPEGVPCWAGVAREHELEPVDGF